MLVLPSWKARLLSPKIAACVHVLRGTDRRSELLTQVRMADIFGKFKIYRHQSSGIVNNGKP
jgi:hypothetical protein